MTSKGTTKERILDAALELFANQGYEQVTMEAIASAVGIKAPSLYKHYASKQEIYDSIIQRSEEVFYAFSANLGISEDRVATTQGLLHLDTQSLLDIGMALFDHLLHDSFTQQFRKMLTMRQYSDTKMAEVYLRFYIKEPLRYQGAVAAAMVEASGGKGDAELLGLEFYSPIFLLVACCDADASFEPEARRLLVKHMEHFFSADAS